MDFEVWRVLDEAMFKYTAKNSLSILSSLRRALLSVDLYDKR
jgi:hypothetical protein